MSDLDAKPCVADLDAREFCRGYTNPLEMMGVALDRYLPGRNAMLGNESMYTDITIQVKSIAEYPKELSFFCNE